MESVGLAEGWELRSDVDVVVLRPKFIKAALQETSILDLKLINEAHLHCAE